MRKKLFLIIIGILLLTAAFKVVPFVLKFAPTAGQIILSPLGMSTLQQTDGKTNVLLLGIGGGTHDGPDLTDTIMLASFDQAANKVTLISIPRDLWIPDLQGKINSAYAVGEENNQHKGLILAKSVVSKVTGVTIHYAARIDFDGFVKAIDEVGGVDVNVARTLDDYEYPITGKEDDTCGHTDQEIQDYTKNASSSSDLEFFPCRYKHLHFDPGLQHMDGETALEYVRSRHASGSEGTDFARSARQQLVIEAFRSKLLSLQTLVNPSKLFDLYGIVKDSIDTDVKQQDLGLFFGLGTKLKTSKIENAVIDFGDAYTGRAGLLINPPLTAQYDYASVLLPRIGDGNFSEIQSYIQCEINTGGCKVSDNPITPVP